MINTNTKIDLNQINNKNIDLIISNGYPYKINKNIINKYKNKIINIHASFLPWEKGIGANLFLYI